MINNPNLRGLSTDVEQSVLQGRTIDYHFGNVTFSDSNVTVCCVVKTCGTGVKNFAIQHTSSNKLIVKVMGIDVITIPKFDLSDKDNIESELQYLEITNNLSTDFVTLLRKVVEMVVSMKPSLDIVSDYR